MTLGLTINDGQSCKVGTKLDFDSSHEFDLSKKISKIETIIDNDEGTLLQTNFFCGQELLVAVGFGDYYVK